VPGDATTAVSVNNGRAIHGSFKVLGSPSCGVHRIVFKQQDGVFNELFNAPLMKFTLQVKSV
jgi:hypothetical protein